MPVFIGDVLESCGGPILDLAGNKVKGVGIFDNVGSRNELDTEFRTSGYLSVVGGDLEVYSGSEWASANSWTKIASEFSLYDTIDPPDGAEDTSPARATSFVVNTEEDQDRYSFGVYDTTDDQFRKVTGADLASIITHYFGEQLAVHLSETTGNDISVYSDSTNGVVGDINGDGVVGVSDILELLSNFGGLEEGIYRNYNINLGSTFYSGSGESEPLIGTAEDFGSGQTTVLEDVFGVDSFGNNYSITGDVVGDDITIDNSSFLRPRIIVEHLDNENNAVDLISFLVSPSLSVPTSVITDINGNETYVGHSIRFYTSGDPSETIVATGSTFSGSSITSQPIKLAVRVYLYNSEGNLTTVSGLPYSEVILGDLISPPFDSAYDSVPLPLSNIDTSSIIPQLITDFALSINLSVTQIHFEIVVKNNGINLQFGGAISGLCDEFEIKNLKIGIVGAGGLG